MYGKGYLPIDCRMATYASPSTPILNQVIMAGQPRNFLQRQGLDARSPCRLQMLKLEVIICINSKAPGAARVTVLVFCRLRAFV